MADETKGKDNNKRLLLLEGGVASLAAVLGELGVTVPEGADPIVLVIDLAKGQAATIDELSTAAEAAIAAVGRADAAEAKLAELEPKIAAVGSFLLEHYPDRITVEECSLSQVTRILDEQSASLVEALNLNELLEGQIEALQSAGNAEAEAAPARERPESARDFGPSFGGLDREDLAALFCNGDVGLEISFSNGDYELVELPPIPIKASDLVTAEGRYLVPVIFARGGEHREDLHGAALVHEGDQIAYCAFPTPIALEPKQERRFEKTITFG